MPKATQLQMRHRYDVLYAICETEQPVSCRGVYYRTLGTHLPFARKDTAWAHAVSNALTTMRREGWVPLGGKTGGKRIFLPHPWITEPGRNTLRPNTWGSIGPLLKGAARQYRRKLWTDDNPYVEIWSEAATMIGVLSGVTGELDVYLRPAGGFSSETLSWNAAQDINARGRETFIYQVGDFDPYGMEAWQCVKDRLGQLVDVPVYFERIAATVEDRDHYFEFTHPVKRPKNNHAIPAPALCQWAGEWRVRTGERLTLRRLWRPVPPALEIVAGGGYDCVALDYQ